MRHAALIVPALLLALAGCMSSGQPQTDSPYVKPNSLMAEEISSRIERIPYQHREELLQNLLWLQQTGEQAIPSLLTAMRHENPKVRSSSAWVMGRMRDRRVIPGLRPSLQDPNETVRLECARTLLVLGDLSTAPMLIEGLDSERKEVRFLCHEALKSVTGRDFGYDHLSEDMNGRRTAALSWRQWWGEYSGDVFFAQNYAQQNGLTMPAAAPSGEIKPVESAPTLQDPQQQAQAVPSNEAPAPLPVGSPANTPVTRPGNQTDASGNGGR